MLVLYDLHRSPLKKIKIQPELYINARDKTPIMHKVWLLLTMILLLKMQKQINRCSEGMKRDKNLFLNRYVDRSQLVYGKNKIGCDI